MVPGPHRFIRELEEHQCPLLRELGVERQRRTGRPASRGPDVNADRVKGRPFGWLALRLKDPLRSASKQERHEYKSLYVSDSFT